MLRLELIGPVTPESPKVSFEAGLDERRLEFCPLHEGPRAEAVVWRQLSPGLGLRVDL